MGSEMCIRDRADTAIDEMAITREKQPTKYLFILNFLKIPASVNSSYATTAIIGLTCKKYNNIAYNS